MPYLPIHLDFQGRIVSAVALVDSGAAINVLPYRIGLELGAAWEDQPATLILGGNLARFPARPLVVSAVVGEFSAVRLAFAWT